MKKYKNKKLFNDTLLKALNKRFGFPENYTGKIKGFEEAIPLTCKIFGSDHVEEVKEV